MKKKKKNHDILSEDQRIQATVLLFFDIYYTKSKMK